MSANQPITVALLALPEATISTLYGLFDLFRAVAHDRGPGEQKVAAPAFRPLLVAPTSAVFESEGGVHIKPHGDLSLAPSPDIICIPSLRPTKKGALAERYPMVMKWLREQHERGVVMASACTGSFLLAESGLLDGGEAATHRDYCDLMARRHPEIAVQHGRTLVATGRGERVITAGGGASWQDLALYLIGRFAGPEHAVRIARIYLLEWLAQGHLPFAAMARTRQVEDAIIAECQTWLAEHYGSAAPVAAMIQRSGLPERSFNRRFEKATGMTPLTYVQILRLEEAKQVLETTDMPIDDVAQAVGYDEASFFRRLFRRRIGISPLEYRRRFRRAAKP